MNLKELLEMKGALAAQAKAVLTAGEREGRMSPEQESQFDKLHADIEAINAQIARSQKQEKLEAEVASTLTPPAEREAAPVELTAQERVEALRAWTLAGHDSVQLTDAQRSVAARAGYNLGSNKLTLMKRALSVGTGSAGGYTTPVGFVPVLEKALVTYGAVRNVARLIQTDTGNPLYFPTANDTSNTGAILAENTQIAASTDPTFSQLRLDAYLYTSKPVLVSIQLLQDTGVDVTQFIGESLGTRIARAQNTHYTTGDGSSKPNGIVTASTLGKTAAGAAAITYAELVDLEHSVDPVYRNGGKFMFKDSTLAAFKKLLDGENRPLWNAGMTGNAPDRVLGYEYVINSDMPAMTTGLKSVLFGSLDKYLVRECTEIVLQRLNERYADYHQVAFLAFMRSDADLLDAGTNPVKHLIQA